MRKRPDPLVKLPPNVKRVRSKGRTYHYFVKWEAGRAKTTRLPGAPWSPEFMAAWSALYDTGRPSDDGPGPGSIHDVIVRYRQSQAFRALSPRTRDDYGRVLDYIATKCGAHGVATFPRAEVVAARDANAHRPRFANYVVQLLSILFGFARELELCDRNPAAGVKKLRMGDGYAAWSRAALSAFFPKIYAVDPVVGWGCELMWDLGQRPSDVLGLTWAAWDGRGFNIRQGKTGAALWVPPTAAMLPRVVEAKAATLGLAIVGDESGQPFGYDRFEKRFRKARTRFGEVLHGLSMHGLRKSAGGEASESGASDSMIQALLGHETREMAELYSKSAEQRRLAEAAQALRRKG